MTLNASIGVSPSSHSHISTQNPDALASAHRRNTVGSPTSAVFKPGASIPLGTKTVVQSSFLPLLAEPSTTSTHLNGTTRSNPPYRSRSPSQKGAAAPRRRQSSQSPVRGDEQARKTTGVGHLGNGRKNNRLHLVPRNGVPNMPGKRHDGGMQQPMTVPRPHLRNHHSNCSNTSTTSTSLPSTPNHLPRANGVSRSPSPPTLLDSPRSAASEPATTVPYHRIPYRCEFETALVNARRRMPYSLGVEKLPKEKPRLERLATLDEEMLTKEMEAEFERLKPSSESETRRRKFLQKLNRILNEEWPGYDTKVHAFGSTENHLCMNDSDVDVCITTTCKEIEATCKLAMKLSNRGMKRVVCVPGAKVPIVKIWDPEYEVACDMNVNNTLALDNTRMIKTYVEIDERVRPLALIIKHWTKERILNDAATGGTLSSYTWICMILSFLQTREPPILPSLHMRPHKPKPRNNGIDVSFDDDIDSLRGWGVKNTETLGGLLFAFFKKYGHELDYETAVISVRQGKLLSKQEKKWQYLQNNRLCVEEPFSITRNLGNTADDASMRGIHIEFRRAHRILAETASLAKCCEPYEFPPEEPHHIPPPPPSRPVTLSRSNSNHRNRNGYNGNPRGGRGYQYNNNRGGNFANRRASSSAAFNPNVIQPQFYNPELFGYFNAQEQLLALQAAQMQAQILLQTQQAAQAHQYHGHRREQQNNAPNSTTASSTNGSANGQDQAYNNFNPFAANWLYSAHLYSLNMLYPNFALGNDASTAPTSPPRTPGLPPDHRYENPNRIGVGRGSRRTGYNNGPRSQSQPPPLYSTNGYGRGMPMVGVPSSEDEDFGDHSSNGNPPETPPEEADEYVGYYTIGGTLQPDVAVVDPQISDVEEPFSEQKMEVDCQKQFSHDRISAPLRSQGPSPAPVAELPPPYASKPNIPNGVPESLKPRMVNGNGHLVNGNGPKVNGVPAADAPTRLDGAKDITSPAKRTKETKLLAQKLLEVHNHNQASRSPRSNASTSEHGGEPAESSLPPASISITGSDDGDDTVSSKLSPGLRQRAATTQLLWTNSRVPLTDPLKPKGINSSQEDLALPLSPVPEGRTPSRNSTRRGGESKGSKPAANGTKASTKSDPTPPTPAPAERNGRNNHNGGRSRGNGGRSSGNNNGRGGSEPKTEQPQQKAGDKNGVWKKQNNKKAKKRTQSAAKQDTAKDTAATVERKGG